MSWETYVSLVPQPRNGERRDFSRCMNSIFSDFLDLDPAILRTGDKRTRTPRNVSLREESDKLIVEVEAPRFEEKDFDISLADGKLTLRAERSIEHQVDGKPSKKTLESWSRIIELPFEVDEQKIDAQLAKGILTITLPKLPQVKPEVKKIAVHS